MTRASDPSTGVASMMSRPLPCGMPSRMSMRTTSLISRSARRCARVAPTFPPPTTVTFRFMNSFLVNWRAGLGLDRDPLDLEAGAEQQRAGADERARGVLLLEKGRVDLVEGVVLGEVGAEDLHADEVVHGGSRRLHPPLHTLHDQARLGGRVRGRLAVRLQAERPREVDRLSYDDRVAEWAVVLSVRKPEVGAFLRGSGRRGNRSNRENGHERGGD